MTKKTDARDESCPEDMYISRKMTNAEVYECATAVGHKLRIEIGLELGDKVIICLEPGLEFIVAFLGTMLAGLVPVPIYPAMPSAMLDTQEECHIARVARDCGASYALTSVTYHAAARLASLRKRFPELPHDVLDRAALRQISVAVRKVGVGQRTLGAFSDEEGSSGSVSNHSV